LAVFFFVAGLELKRELVVGELSDRRAAALPVFAAVFGMLVPAAVVIVVSGGEALEGGAWATAVATDIAFALAVLAIAGAALPSGVRVLLLSIAVVDDLLAIALIAILFTGGVEPLWLLASAVGCGIYWSMLRLGFERMTILIGLALAVWICVHASGVHATVAGIALGLLTPVRPRPGETESLGVRLEHRVHPVSAGFAVPIFGLAATGIPLAAIGDAATSTVPIAIFCGLLFGKVLGIMGGARLSVRLGVGALPDGVGWADVLPVAVLGGVGFTVSLLITQLAFEDVVAEEAAAASVLAASVVASLVAVALLRRRSRAH
jgi:NhaA family Na+:H+ antiporter